MENSKALILRESMQEVASRSRLQLPADILKQEHDLSRDVWAQAQLIQAVSRQEHVDSTRLLSMYNRLLGFKQKYDRFQKEMRQNYPGYSQLSYGLETVSLTGVQKKLPDEQTLLLEYFQGKDHITLMAISKNDARTYSLVLDSALFRAVGALRLMVNHPDNEHTNADVALFSNAAHLLYTRLLDAALKDAGNMHHLIIIPDGEFATMPFHLLLTESASGNNSYRNLPYALRRYSFQYEFSAATLGLRGSKKAATKLYAGFAPAYETGPVVTRSTPDSAIYANLFPEARGGRMPGLRYNQPEVAEASQLFRGDQYTGSAASESMFKREAAQYRILHMALHAFTDDVNPAYSQLIFSNPSPADTAEDGVLHAYELYNLDLRSDLAVLSACRSGGGRVSRGEGVMSLSWAFKRAGCPNVVMSVWNADDLSAKAIMGAFFRQLAQGRSKADALQRAQLDFLDNAEKSHCHPYYWAPFSLIGDNLPLEVPYSFTAFTLFVLAALAVLGFLIYLWLKTRATAGHG
jgi:CHAT domain-containing protein